jgi:hypothetical protein
LWFRSPIGWIGISQSTSAPEAWMSSRPSITPLNVALGEKSRTNTSYSPLRATQEVSGANAGAGTYPGVGWAATNSPAARRKQEKRLSM